MPAVAAAPGPGLAVPRPVGTATLLGTTATPGSSSPNWFHPGTSADFALCWERPGPLPGPAWAQREESGLGPDVGTLEGEKERTGGRGALRVGFGGTIVESALPCCLLL